MDYNTPGSSVLRSLPDLAQIHVHWLDDAICLILCHFLLLPSIFPSIRVFSSESVLRIKWPKYWSFSISPSNEYSGLISFRIDWLDLLAVQGTLKSLLWHHSSKASILQCSALWSSSYILGKTTSLTVWIFVGKVMSLLFNMLSRFVIAFLLKSKHLLISWLQPSSAVILEPKKIKSIIACTERDERAEWKCWPENMKKTKIMASGPITSWQTEEEKVEAHCWGC